MRCWKIPDGRLLVEEREGQYYLLGPEGRMEAAYCSGQGSDREHLTTTTYAVVGAELTCRFEDDNTDMADRPPDVTDSVELRGLIPAIAPDAGEKLRQALAAMKSQAKAAATEDAGKLAAFERDLPDFGGKSGLEFVFSYDAEEAIVVRGPGGIEVWRESGYPYHGHYRFDQLQKILRRRYKKRLRSFRPDLPDMKAGMAFNPE